MINNIRSLNPFLVGLVFCVSALSAAGYFQYVMGLEPCPLCMLQRMAIVAVGVSMLFGWVFLNRKPLGAAVAGFSGLLLSAAGFAVSLRHIWIQNLPADKVPSCGPGFDFIVDNLPFMDAIKTLLAGSGECSEVLWTFLGFSIPAWTAFLFLILMMFSIAGLTRLSMIKDKSLIY